MRSRRPFWPIFLLAASLLASGAYAPATAMESTYFRTSDGVRLHVIVAGPANAPTMVFVPGWTMPAWIFQRADPGLLPPLPRRRPRPARPGRQRGAGHRLRPGPPGRGHRRPAHACSAPARCCWWAGRSACWTAWPMSTARRPPLGRPGADRQLRRRGPAARRQPRPARPLAPVWRVRPRWRASSAGMFRSPPGEAYLERLTETALRTPPDASAATAELPRSPAPTGGRRSTPSASRSCTSSRPRFVGAGGEPASPPAAGVRADIYSSRRARPVHG